MNVAEIKNEQLNCTGCGACVQMCPHSCITMEYDDEGFLYPSVNTKTCVGCGICVRYCPDINIPAKNAASSTCLAVISTADETEHSASGGAFMLLAESFVRQLHGVVYGCRLDLEKKAAEHVRIDSAEDLKEIQGSKYVQSSIWNILGEVREDLESGRNVLFSGTPCQVACLKSCFNQYGNLYTVDLICHGVPSPIVFRDYLKWVERKIGTLCDYRFRIHSKRSIQGYLAFARGQNGEYRRRGQDDPYYHAFLHELSYRHSCYTCKYTTAERIGDITLGDCNSIIYRDPAFSKHRCASLVIINNSKGAMLWQRGAAGFTSKEIPLAQEIRYNKRIITSSRLNENDRKAFYEAYRDGTLFEQYPFFKKSTAMMIRKQIIGLFPEYWIRMIRYYKKSGKKPEQSY